MSAKPKVQFHGRQKKPEPEPEVVSDSDSEAEEEDHAPIPEEHKVAPKQSKAAPKQKKLRDHSDDEDSEEESEEKVASEQDSEAEDSEEDPGDKEARTAAIKEAERQAAIEKAKAKKVKAEAARRAMQEETMKKEAAKRQKMAEQRAAKETKQQAEQAKPLHHSRRAVCAVPGCNNIKFARGYCSLHIVTAADNQQPAPPQRVRNTLNLWYRRDTPSKGKITWKFVHHGHRHVVIMTFDEYQNKRRVYVDDKEQGCGSHNDENWFITCIAGREVKFNVVVMQSFQGQHWRTDLWIDGMSFERGRERWMKHICQKQVQELCTLPNFDMEKLGMEQNYLHDHWKREQVQQKTKSMAGNYKSVVSWCFTIKEGVHVITLEHGTKGSGKRKIIVGTGANATVHLERKLGLFESNTSAMYDVEVGNVHCRVCIRDLKKCERRAGLVDDEDPSAGYAKHFQYDLLIEQQPFENCRMSTLQYAQMGNKELVRADREVSLTDKEMMRIIKMFNIDAMSLGAAHVPEVTQGVAHNPNNARKQAAAKAPAAAPAATPAAAPAAAAQDDDDDEVGEVHISGLNIAH